MVPHVWQELPTLPGHVSLSVFSGVCVVQSLVFCVVFCRSLFAILTFFVCLLYCLHFFDLQLLMDPLILLNDYEFS